VVKPDGPIVLIDTMIASGAALRSTGGPVSPQTPHDRARHRDTTLIREGGPDRREVDGRCK
jgi:hypothetical protein